MVEEAIVIAAEVARGTDHLAAEPVTTATLRDDSGRDHVVRIVGGPTIGGGFARLAGYVVPKIGARVRLDLREPRRAAPLSGGGASWAPNTPAGTWDTRGFPVPFVLAVAPNRDLGETAAGELDVALRTWGRVSCTSFRARFDGMKNLIPGDDGDNGVFFHDDSWPAELVAGVLAQTVVHEDASGKLHDADIHVNGADFRFSTDGAPGTQDARSVFVHEIGHALGLGHSTDPRATMNTSGSGLRWRSLERDDVDGVCALYPGAGAAGCDSEPCPPGFLCVAGACQRPFDRADVCSPCTPSASACEAAGDGARCIDIGSGVTAGRVCGRACAHDDDCGAGFSCRPTTEAGDLQCLSRWSCANGASTCRTNADCKEPGSACRAGACVGPAPVTPVPQDAGVDANAGSNVTNLAPGGGCDCEASGSPPFRAAPVVLVLWLAAVLFGRRAAFWRW